MFLYRNDKNIPQLASNALIYKSGAEAYSIVSPLYASGPEVNPCASYKFFFGDFLLL